MLPANLPFTLLQLVLNLPHTHEMGTKDQSLTSLPADNFHYSFYKDCRVYLYIYTPVRLTELEGSAGTPSGQL
jgi:hypothetical protein